MEDEFEDLDPRTPERNSRDYSVSQLDLDSIQEVRVWMQENKYKNDSEAKEHLDFLEGMADRLKKVVKSEKEQGLSSWDVINTIKEIEVVYSELYNLYVKLKSKPRKEVIVEKPKAYSKLGITGISSGEKSQGFSRM